MSSRSRSSRNSRNRAPTSPTDPLAAIRAKFARLRQIRTELEVLKQKYREHDTLVAELLPLFVSRENGRWIINEQFSLGTEVHTLVPYFFDQRKGVITVKQWKSTAFPAFTVDG